LATGRASGHKNFASISVYSRWMTTKMGGVQPLGQPHLPTRNRTMGNPAKLQDGVPIIMKVLDLMPCSEVGGGDGRILLMFQTA